MLFSGAVEIVAASIVAGLVQHAALHPLDTIKVRLQYAKSATISGTVRSALGEALKDLELPGTRRTASARVVRELGNSAKRGFREAPFVVDVVGAAHMIRKTGIFSLYAGIAPALAAVVPTAIVYMPTYEFSAAALKASAWCPANIVAPLAGVATGVVCAVVRVPASVLKSRVQLGLAPSAFAAFQYAMKHGGGVRSLYSGFTATLVLDVGTAVVQFSVLDGLKRTNVQSHAAMGFVASALAAVVTEPIDVVRTRLMATLKGKEDRYQYRSVVHGLSTAFRTEGLAALYRGLLPRLLLKSVGGALWYSVYMHTRDRLRPGAGAKMH
ncbi:mitochondrial carrier domain-containing protein [Pelagophyceae sp. CCMP2097]|nr:mitochondrial carrier domain-containing protein [Pelagophyceae sp. CCMP2097]|mmetsp:Transcript_27297/g.93860  ORF Transcript_27297/g.93860 Transcript_27297/m.93860 type:complete len:326 (+) Transcript_27297:144-1121(+)